MRDISKSVIVRMCLECKHYTIIFPESASNGCFLKLFDLWHLGHIIQTININELDSTYTCITERKREKIYEVLKNG